MHSSVVILIGLGLFIGCAEEAESRDVTPYRLGQAMVIGDRKGGELTEVDADCHTAACDAVHERCGDGAFADVLLDDEGEVVDVVCYKQSVDVVELGEAPVASARAGNDTVLVLDADDDGEDVTGDVTLEGNNAVVYGAGADVSVIGGTLALEKNNAIVRGVTVRGDVTIDKNNAKLLFTTIEGDLTINGNNTTLAESRVLGQVLILGNNTVLVQNELASTGPITGKNLRCNGNVHVDAADLEDEPTRGTDAGAPFADAGAQHEPVLCVGSKKPGKSSDD